MFKVLSKFLLIDLRYINAIAIRLFIVILTEILFIKYEMEYTDIDYHVVSDGSKYLINFESPYNRETYRYTPLLALIMIPNHIINYNFGKVLLCFTDVLVGLAIEVLLVIQNTNKPRNVDNSITNEEDLPVIYRNEIVDKCLRYLNNPFAKTSIIYLYNPIAIAICTRGSSDCIITLLVIMTLIFIELGYFPIAGLCFGLSIHFKIYPVIYGPALYLYLLTKEVSFYKYEKSNFSDENENEKEQVRANYSIVIAFMHHYKKIKFTVGKISRNIYITFKFIMQFVLNFKAIAFASITIGVFLSFLFAFYILFGNLFLKEYLFYHLTRKDHRHNFSMFYYPIYLFYNSGLSGIISYIAFLPQMTLIILSTLFLFHDINLCMLVNTMIFVTFNKVITAQYFLWYISLIPLIVPYNKVFDIVKNSTRALIGIILTAAWLILEIVWNNYSHHLEYKGENYFLELWGIDVLFFLTNCSIISLLVISQIK